MILLVAGGRRYTERDPEADVLVSALEMIDCCSGFDPTCPEGVPTIGGIVTGDAPGADAFAASWGRFWARPVEVFAADWKGRGRVAGPERNQRMVDRIVALRDGAHPRTVAALLTEGGPGTADVRERLERAGIQIFEAGELAAQWRAM